MLRSTMNVTSAGSTLRLRSSSAAWPIDDQVAAVQQHEGILVRDALALQRAVEDLGDRAGGGGDRHQETLSRSETKRSDGTSSRAPAPWASSKNRASPARSLSPKRYRSFSKYRAR